MPPLESWIAMSGGVPRRPACAVTIPATLTVVPIGSRRALAMVTIPDDGDGVGDADGLGEADAVGEGARVGVGVGATEALGAGVGEGEGVGAGTTVNSPDNVAWIR